jgi:hypothetical protein
LDQSLALSNHSIAQAGKFMQALVNQLQELQSVSGRLQQYREAYGPGPSRGERLDRKG